MKSLLLLRLLIVVHAVLAFLQPVLAGTYLTGYPGANLAHEMSGNVITTVALIQVVAALLYWRRGGGRSWPLWASAGLLAGDTAQMGVGYTRLLQFHVPLGVAIVTASIIFAFWAVRPR